MTIIAKAQSIRLLYVLIGLLLVGSCSEDKKVAKVSPPQEPAVQQNESRFDINRIASGALLFQQYCSQCHGPEAQGHPDWKHAKQQGYSAAPPLDGSGPAATRTKAQLISVIKNGVDYDGTPVMPSWGSRLSDSNILDIITWFQALWPEDVYAKWLQKNASDKVRQSKTK